MSVFNNAMKQNDGNGEEKSKGPSVFSKVAEAAKAASSAPAGGQKSLEEIAKEVIRGNWGVGQERIDKLTAAGYDASAVQKLVNEMMKK